MANNSATHTATRKAIQEYLAWQGATVYGNLGGLGQVRGRADVTACVRGRYVDVEVKTGGGQQNSHQREQQARVQQSGGIYIVAHSVQDVEDRLAELGLVVRGLC